MTRNQLEQTAYELYEVEGLRYCDIAQRLAEYYRGGQGEPSRGWVAHLVRTERARRNGHAPVTREGSQGASKHSQASHEPGENTMRIHVQEPLRDDQRVQRVTRAGKRFNPQHPGEFVVFDIECTDLNATGRRGFLVCCSFLPLRSETPYTLSIAYTENAGDDARIVADVIDELAKYDILIGHNINAFDLNWLNTRRAILAAHGHTMPPLRRWYTFDTYQAAKSLAYRVDRKSLAFLCDALDVPCVKTSIYPAAWNEVRSPVDREFQAALDDITYHCEQDVIANRGLFLKLWYDSFGLPNSPLKLWKLGDAPKVARKGR